MLIVHADHSTEERTYPSPLTCGSPLYDSKPILMHCILQISGNGHLDQAASIPGSGKDTRFDLLQIFLVSDQTKLNLTVSEGPGLLQQEQGSTVKHLNYNLPSCVPPGNYNVIYLASPPETGSHYLAAHFLRELSY
jgi:hypothetical protein